jgi:PadR family transcriptional regulator AphA
VSIKHAILGFLSETPLTGYDLKKKFSTSDVFHWSGNSNQIYRSLVDLHEEGLVTLDVQQQENKPPRKIYSLTAAGTTALREWMLSTPELPQLQNPLLVQLTWADQLEPAQLSAMLADYEAELREYTLTLREQAERARSGGLRDRIAAHWIDFYQRELDWVVALRHTLER